jgi:transposase
MEASSSAHHWARKLVALGLDARIIAAQLVSPYRRQGASGKNDANDAAAICEAASRPQMHFVPLKSIEQQSLLCVHRLREGFMAERTACINRIRGLLAEFGLVFAQSPAALALVLADVLEDASNEMKRWPVWCCSARTRSGTSWMRTSPGATNASPRMPKTTPMSAKRPR